MAISDPYEQTKWNRMLLILCALFTVAGLGNNIIRPLLAPWPSEGMAMGWFASISLWALCIAFAATFGLVRGPSTFETWGFVIDRRLWISLILVLVSGLIVLPQIMTQSWFLGTPQLISVGTVTMEEVFFRGILISTLLAVVQPKGRWGVAGLICAAAAMFTIGHIPTHTAAEVFGVFTSAIVLGYVYHYTGSLLLPIFIHVVANTAEKAGPIGGVMAIVGYFVVAGLVWLWSRSKARVEVPAT
jgi:membrane protease YdiL (CAAX protease family)